MATATKSNPEFAPLSLWQDAVGDCGTQAGGTAFINRLRFVSMACRAKPRTELFEACAQLHATRSASPDAYVEALMRCLGEALGRPARLHSPGTAEMTFDERWLVRLAAVSASADHDSFRFLIESRVARENRRMVAFLIGRIAAFFGLN